MVNLWRGVLSQACRDLASPYKLSQRNITDWVLDTPEDVMMCCDFAEVDGEQFIRQMREMISLSHKERRKTLLAIANILYRQRGKLDEEDNFFSKVAGAAEHTPGSKGGLAGKQVRRRA